MIRMIREYGMFSAAGNLAVERLIEDAKTLDHVYDIDQLVRFLTGEMKDISKEHGEVYDTVVRENIVQELGNPCLTIFDIDERN